MERQGIGKEKGRQNPKYKRQKGDGVFGICYEVYGIGNRYIQILRI